MSVQFSIFPENKRMSSIKVLQFHFTAQVLYVKGQVRFFTLNAFVFWLRYLWWNTQWLQLLTLLFLHKRSENKFLSIKYRTYPLTHKSNLWNYSPAQCAHTNINWLINCNCPGCFFPRKRKNLVGAHPLRTIKMVFSLVMRDKEFILPLSFLELYYRVKANIWQYTTYT